MEYVGKVFVMDADGRRELAKKLLSLAAATLYQPYCPHEWVTEVVPADGCEDSWGWWDCSTGFGPAGGPISAPIDKVFCVNCGITAAEVKDGRKES